jgi:low affinity Fe/Cu permease
MIENPIIKWIGLVSISIVGIYSFVLLDEEKYLSAVLTCLIVIPIKILASKIDNELIKNRKTKEEEEQAIKIAKQKKEQAIQDEIDRKEQAKYEEEERKRKQRELEIWNSKSPNERAKIKFKEMDDAIHNLNGNYADRIFREWEAEFEKYVIKNDIISAKDKIFQLRLLYTQQEQRQWEIEEERQHQRNRDYQNERIRREQEKNNKKWYCPKCGRVVPGRNSPTDRNCIGGKSHEWQLRS